jgi:hypothetical protein
MSDTSETTYKNEGPLRKEERSLIEAQVWNAIGARAIDIRHVRRPTWNNASMDVAVDFKVLWSRDGGFGYHSGTIRCQEGRVSTSIFWGHYEYSRLVEALGDFEGAWSRYYDARDEALAAVGVEEDE